VNTTPYYLIGCSHNHIDQTKLTLCLADQWFCALHIRPFKQLMYHIAFLDTPMHS